jgi:hypothetical protein
MHTRLKRGGQGGLLKIYEISLRLLYINAEIPAGYTLYLINGHAAHKWT